jgi:hypothetical protein
MKLLGRCYTYLSRTREEITEICNDLVIFLTLFFHSHGNGLNCYPLVSIYIISYIFLNLQLEHGTTDPIMPTHEIYNGNVFERVVVGSIHANKQIFQLAPKI